MSIQAVLDLLEKVAIVPPPAPEPGKPFRLNLTPPPQTLGLLAGDQPAAAFKLILDKVDLSGLDVDEAMRTLAVDVGKLAPTLDVDVGSLVPVLSAVLGAVKPDLDTTVGTLDPDLQAAVGTLRPSLEAILGAMAPQLRAVVGALAADLQLEIDPAQTGTIKGTIPQDPANPGSITGSIEQAQEELGGIRLPSLKQKVNEILGVIEGSLVRSLLGSITYTVNWRVEDQNGRPLKTQDEPSPECVINGSRTDPEVGPTVALLPEFVEYVRDATNLFTRRRIFCDLTVSVEVPGIAQPITLATEVGPLEVPIPKVPVPSLLVMTEHEAGETNFPGGVLIGLPSGSEIETLPEIGGALDDVIRVVDLVIGHAPSPAITGRFQGLKNAVSRLNVLVTTGRPGGIKADIVDDLWWVEIPGRWPANFENTLSALFLFGPPGRRVACHVKKFLWEAQGVFLVTLGPFAWAIVERFSDTEDTPSGPPGPKLLRPIEKGVSHDGGSTLDVIKGDPQTSSTGSFHDALSSYQFLAPGEPYIFRGW